MVGVVTAVVVWLLPDNTPQAVTYTNVSTNIRVCLLSTTHDTNDADRIWPAIQAASTRSAVNAQHITAPAGPSDQLVPYLNSLLALHCGLIITAGADLTQPAVDLAKTQPQQRFLLPTPHEQLTNVDSIPNQTEALTALIASAAPALGAH